jgi:hypothetical protein
MGLVVGVGELSGGVVGPLVAGRMGDAFGLNAALWLQIGLAIAGGLTALLLTETNPRVLARQHEEEAAVG